MQCRGCEPIRPAFQNAFPLDATFEYVQTGHFLRVRKRGVSGFGVDPDFRRPGAHHLIGSLPSVFRPPQKLSQFAEVRSE